jgi:hypothetical protein
VLPLLWSSIDADGVITIEEVEGDDSNGVISSTATSLVDLVVVVVVVAFVVVNDGGDADGNSTISHEDSFSTLGVVVVEKNELIFGVFEIVS